MLHACLLKPRIALMKLPTSVVSTTCLILTAFSKRKKTARQKNFANHILPLASELLYKKQLFTLSSSVMQTIKKGICFLVILLSVNALFAQKGISISIENSAAAENAKSFYSADDSMIQYVGRIQNTNPAFPRFWMPGVYLKAKFEGNTVSFFLNDEVLYGNVRNYVEIIIDGKLFRLQTKYVNNKFIINGLKKGMH